MGLNAWDLVVIAAYLTAVTLFGLRFRRKQTTLKSYFLADKSIPWWAIMLSIVAAETRPGPRFAAQERAGVSLWSILLRARVDIRVPLCGRQGIRRPTV